LTVAPTFCLIDAISLAQKRVERIHKQLVWVTQSGMNELHSITSKLTNLVGVSTSGTNCSNELGLTFLSNA
jgi:hypothetical protein